MTSLVEIQGQIEKLQKQANDIRVKEFDRTVQEILTKMQAFGITIKDLQANKAKSGAVKKGRVTGPKGGTGGKKAIAKRSGKALGTAPVKYRGPNGETWTGRGLTPRWLSQLVQQGRQRQEFAVAAPA